MQASPQVFIWWPFTSYVTSRLHEYQKAKYLDKSNKDDKSCDEDLANCRHQVRLPSVRERGRRWLFCKQWRTEAILWLLIWRHVGMQPSNWQDSKIEGKVWTRRKDLSVERRWPPFLVRLRKNLMTDPFAEYSSGAISIYSNRSFQARPHLNIWLRLWPSEGVSRARHVWCCCLQMCHLCNRFK